MKISNRLKNSFEDVLVAEFSVKEIRRFFDNNDIDNIIDEELPVTGVRRALVTQYYKSVNWNNEQDVKNVLQSFSDIISALEEKADGIYGGGNDNRFYKAVEQLKSNLTKDGLVYNGTIISEGATNILSPQPISHTYQFPKEVYPNEDLIALPLQQEDPIQIANPIVNQPEKPTVFISYSWDGQEHEDQILRFTDFLRGKGFSAELDKMLIQKQSAIDFSRMMHQALTDYKKVIIVLSKGYKSKADAFTGGVGNEYSMIINDINTNPKKYILVSFEGINNELVPFGLKGREIVDLSKGENLNKLYHKLQYNYRQAACFLSSLSFLSR